MRRHVRVVVPGVVFLTVAGSLFLATCGRGRSASLPPEGPTLEIKSFEEAAARTGEPPAAFTRFSNGRFVAAVASRGQLVVLPDGAHAANIARVTAPIAGARTELPADRVHLSRVMMMRGRPVATVAYDPAGRSDAPESMRIELIVRDRAGRELSGEAQVATSGLTMMTGRDPLAIENRGCYLIITIPGFTQALQPFVAWKTACGYDVRLATTCETGASRNAIRDYVRAAYATWPNPPLYLLIVGDVDQIPAFNALDNVNDHLYACVDGDDFIADLYVGRFSAQNASDVDLQVAKTVNYESRPDTSGILPGQEQTWFNRALLVAGNSGSSTPKPISNWIRGLLLEMGYTKTDSVYYPPFWEGSQAIRYFVDRGVSMVTYRGWAQGDTAWQPPGYGATGVRRLRNGWMLPVVFSIVCHTGNFGNYDFDCFGEAWLKAGTVEEPCGGVAFVGTGEHFSHTRWNDRIMISIFDLMRYDGLRRMGPIMVGAKNALLAEFPTELYMAEGGEESVEYYHYIYNLLGDPSLAIWTDTPRAHQIPDLPRSLFAGANFVDLHVMEEDGTTPIPDVALAFTQAGQLIGYGETDASGRARACLSIQSADEITCTVTGQNLYPRQYAIPVLTSERSFSCTGAQVAGGAALPGAELRLYLQGRNTGTSGLGAITATVGGPGDVEVLWAETAFPATQPGAEAQSSETIRLRLPADTEDGRRIRFNMTWTEGAANSPAEDPPTDFYLTAQAPALVCTALSDGGDDVFDPGERVSLVATLRNEGSAAAGAIDATLQCIEPGRIEIIDSTAAIAEIAPGAEGANGSDPFTFRIPETMAANTRVPLRLITRSADGPSGVVPITLVVGQVDFSAPVGPIEGGYYAYDSADIDYPGQAPVYRWIECSPAYGGSGQSVPLTIDNYDLEILALPFDFKYFGTNYREILVSDNGWISFDTRYWYDVRNWSLPNTWGGASQVAAFWDNLAPTAPGGDGIYAWHDEANHRFIVEWSRLRNYETYIDDFQTFEVVLLDPRYHSTASGNGEILFQYRQIVDNDWQRMYSTVGIEDPTEQFGLQYCYCGIYADGAAPLTSGLAIKITTEPPVYQPLTTRMMLAEWAPGVAAEKARGRVLVRWMLSDERPLAGLELWRMNEDGVESSAVKINDGLLDPRTAEIADPSGDPETRYRYRLVATNSFGAKRTAGEATYLGQAAGGPDLRIIGSNPMTVATSIYFRSSGTAGAKLGVYDTSGRCVRVLVQPRVNGPHAGLVPWDGRDDSGRPVGAGLYWVRLTAPRVAETARLVVLH